MTFQRAKTTLMETKKIFHFVVLFFILLCIVFAVVLKDKTDLIQQMLDSFMKSKQHIIQTQGMGLAFELFKNNMKAAVLSVGMGIIPFLFIPVYTVVVNAAILGGFYQYFIALPGMSVGMYFASIMPHGIIEIPGFLLGVTLGIHLCIELTKKILKKPSKDFPEVLKDLASVMVLIILPMLVLAAFIEAFVTPTIINRML